MIKSSKGENPSDGFAEINEILVVGMQKIKIPNKVFNELHPSRTDTKGARSWMYNFYIQVSDNGKMMLVQESSWLFKITLAVGYVPMLVYALTSRGVIGAYVFVHDSVTKPWYLRRDPCDIEYVRKVKDKAKEMLG